MMTSAQFNWLPTTTRVVVVEGFGPYPRGTLQNAPPPLVWPMKDPGDILDFVIDYSEALAGNLGDAIATLDVSIFPNASGDLSLTTSSADGSQAVLWLAGGQIGTTYAITVVVGTNCGRSIARTVSLPVAALATPSSTGTILISNSGAPLTDQTGSPITTS
jgi:hypothetical protein